MAKNHESPLSSLVALLASSVKTLEDAYAQAGGYPSLDVPFKPNHDDHDLPKHPQLDDLSRLIVAAAAQIIATVRAPIETVQEYATSSYAAASLNLVVNVHVADILKVAGPKGMHIDEISSRSGVSSERLARLLQYLATRHVFKEVAPDVFANNRISSVLFKASSLEAINADPEIEFNGAPGAAFVGHATDECMRGAVELSSWVKDSGKFKAPFNMGYRTDVDVFQWYELDKRRKRRFHMAMAGGSVLFPPSIFLGGFEWGNLKPDSVVVDVGGGVGSVTLTVLQKHPHSKYVVQDLETVVGSVNAPAKKYWESNDPSALVEGRVKLQVINFFQSQPVKGAAVYFMRLILHDWPSDKCHEILKIVREAAGPDSKLVVFDMIMPYACEYDGPFAEIVSPDKAPYPLLANLGLGMGGFVTSVDIQMMNLLDGQERTVSQFIELGKWTGWKLESVDKRSMMASLVFSPV